ncbi:MAG: aspartate/glutamate racemase family protein [Beijerinckiaceae bacterium]
MPLRVGLIIPSSNRMVEQEMVRHFPAGVVAHVNRLRMTGPNRRPLAQLLPDVERACGELVDAKCDAVAFHCTANSMAEGSGGEAALLDALRRAKAPHVATTSTAVTNALASLNARSIALVTPYTQQATEEETHFFDETGVSVVYAKGCDRGGSDGYCATPAEFWRDQAAALPHRNFDVLFLSCANIQCLGIVQEIEETLRRPVITSNQVVIWETLRQIGWQGADKPQGRLFRTF